MITDDELDGRLRAGDASRGFMASEQGLDALARNAERLAGQQGAPRRRRRLFAGLSLAGLVVFGGAIAAPAAADAIREFLAQSDWRCTFGSECGDPDDGWIDTSAADLPDYLASVYPEQLPFAAPLTREDVLASIGGELASTPALTSETSVQRLFENTAYCSWVGLWLDSDTAGDTASRDDATAVLRDAASWPAMTATDGGGIMDNQAAFAGLAEDGDREGVMLAAQMNACASWDGEERSARLEELQP